MTRSVESLYRPFTIKGLTLPNRIVMAAMTRHYSPGGIPGDNVAAYYRRRAENGCGLIVTEATTINMPTADGYPKTPCFWGDALKGWKRVVDEVHDAGGFIMPQIWHVGKQRHISSRLHHPELMSSTPSGYEKGEEKGLPMSKAEIKATIQAFADAAYSSAELGFDGVQIHGAHGYLIDNFFWSETNKRDDEYGGDLVGRTRFGVEVVEAIRRAVGENFPIVLRISQFKQEDYAAKLAYTPEDLGRFLKPLTDAGVDMYDCSQRRYWEPEFDGSSLNFAGWVKKLSGKPVTTVGSVTLSVDMQSGMETEDQAAAITPIDPLLERLERDEFDLVAVGRAILVDPEWAIKVREQRFQDLRPFDKEALKALV